VAAWPGVLQAGRDDAWLQLRSDQVENVVRQLLAADPLLSALEVQTPGLGEAFTELTAGAAGPMQREAA
jgi:ABC-2 type transport system ATP-binding protein